MEPLVEAFDDNSIDEDSRMEELEESIGDETENLLDEEEEEEDECRVCRGPAEEGRLLLQPCKCSGSMGLVHQECLISWLEVTRGDGRCEICKTKFCFDPQYAENTPDRLPAQEVILGLSSRFLAKWLPLALRICFASFLWLVVAPYLTNCLYLGWIIRPSSILARQEMILSDIVSGAVIGTTIILSFLSLMSFADFLRVLWQQPPGAQQPEGEEQQEEGRENDGADGENNNEEDGNATDDRIIELILERMNNKTISAEIALRDDSATTIDNTRDISVVQRKDFETQLHNTDQGACIGDEEDLDNCVAAGSDLIGKRLRNRAAELRSLAMEREARRQDDNDERVLADGDDDQVDRVIDQFAPLANDIVGIPRRFIGDLDEFNDDSDDEEVDENADDDEEAWMDDDDNDEDDAPLPFQPPGAGHMDGLMDPILQDDQVDMEINVALDELLGLRGPISTLVRNLLWLLAFNATYLGIFGFIPKTVGSMIYSSVFNTTLCDNVLKSIPFVSSEDKNRITVISLLSSLEEESANQNTAFKLSDFATVTLGYLSVACFIVLSRYAMIAVQKAGKAFENDLPIAGQNLNEAPELPRAQRIQNMMGGLGEGMNDLNDEDALGGIGNSIETVLDATVAIIKVCVLLFMKMFLLPLSLGLWLDASTVRLFGQDIAGRLEFAGGDLFSFILLHWVAGITFMLLVTVFLLQLREVAHPDVLARLIRPQEPQPDLLGNLMHETVLTHMKRMLLSLAIYAPLLTLHVTLPVMLFHASGLDSIFTFFQLNFYHMLTPQLQIPLELIIFHLSMLALLERHKNTIGGLQHCWMKFMCRVMGLTEHILPRCVKGFELIGTKPVFVSDDELGDLKVDPFFPTLATKEKDIDQFVLLNIDRVEESITQRSSTILGEQRLNGERVLSIGVRSISLPANEGAENTILRVPTKIGRYRLCTEEHLLATQVAEETKILFYREIQGDEIKRPPEGWDDLGAGGAFVQGRWAWAEEQKSLGEASVAERTPFRPSSKERRPMNLIAKVTILIILSWFAVIFTGLAILSFPLAVGRSFCHLLRIPPKYIHDPLAFCIGAGLFFPTVSLLIRSMNAVDGSLHHRCRRWLGRFRQIPSKKISVVLESLLLWIAVAPLGLGLAYEFVVVKSPEWFLDEKVFLDWKTCAISWFMGTVVLNTWSFLLYFKFFTRQFWSNIGNGILEPPLNEDGNPNPNARNNDREDANAEIGLKWQGKHGRVARFFKIWRSILLDWEWDSVDRTILIDEFARPTTKEIASALVGSSLSYQLAGYAFIAIFKVNQGGFMFPLLGYVELGVFRKSLFRFCMAVHVLFQIGSRSRSSIDRWFEAAHEAARDDRYLIGELLMEYNPEVQAH